MTDISIGTPEQLRDPDYMPALGKAVPLGIQHVLAMFVSNVTPAIIVAGAAGIGFGSDQGALGFPDMSYLIQMSMLFAGFATLIQTIGIGPVGARLPIVQGTSFAFVPIMIPAVAGLGAAGLGGLMTGVVLGGCFHFCLGFFVGRIRFALPPLVTGLIVLMIGLALVKVGVQYAGGGVLRHVAALDLSAAGKLGATVSDRTTGMAAEFGALAYWGPALVVVLVTLAIKFFTKGFLSVAAVFIGIIAGYVVAMMMGQVSFANVGKAAIFQIPMPFKYGFELNWAIIIGMCFMAIVSAIETVGDVSGITKGGAGREATDKEVSGATFADGLGTAVAGVFGGLPNTSFSQNVGLVAMTGDEPPCRHYWCPVPDPLRLHAGGGRDHPHDAGTCPGRRRDRDVRHGLRLRCADAVGCELEPSQHGHFRHCLVGWPWPATGPGGASASGPYGADIADDGSSADRSDCHHPEPRSAGGSWRLRLIRRAALTGRRHLPGAMLDMAPGLLAMPMMLLVRA